MRDEALPPVFLADPLVQRLGGEVVEQVKVLLSRKHGLSRLEHVWGPGDGRSAADLKESVLQLVHEYLVAGGSQPAKVEAEIEATIAMGKQFYNPKEGSISSSPAELDVNNVRLLVTV